MAVAGGHVAVSQAPGITLGQTAYWVADGLLGSQSVSGGLARSTSSPTNPTGTTSTTAVMMGLHGSITPTVTGNVQITMTGSIANDTVNDGASVQISYGTGTAPANAAALTGTQVGSKVTATSAVAAGTLPFTCTAYVTGLTVGTAYWIDAAVAAITGGTASITAVTIVAAEM